MNIMPLRELKNFDKISKLCNESDEPIFLTKNGYGHMVIMSVEVYKKKFGKDAYDAMINSIEDAKKRGELFAD